MRTKIKRNQSNKTDDEMEVVPDAAPSSSSVPRRGLSVDTNAANAANAAAAAEGATFPRGITPSPTEASMNVKNEDHEGTEKEREEQEEDEKALLAQDTALEQAVELMERQKELDAFFVESNKNKFEGLPPYQPPEGFKENVSLFDYQQDGVRWLISQEEEQEKRLAVFWNRRVLGRKKVAWWRCSLTFKMQATPPVPDTGALLCDDMGLGKSIQTLGLLLTCQPAPEDERKTTILVCPVSVLASWKMMINRFVKQDYLSVEIYMGTERHKLLQRIKRKNDVDVLMTSYETLQSDMQNYKDWQTEMAEKQEEKEKTKSNKKKKARYNAWTDGNDSDSENEFLPESEDDEDDHFLPSSMTRKRSVTSKKQGPWIFHLKFYRIILDEAHKIRNAKTSFFAACSEIDASRRLAITGTPFVNKVEDIHSLVTWLNTGNEGASNPILPAKNFETFITSFISQRNEIGLARMRVLLSHLALRRTKDSVDPNALKLPPKRLIRVTVPFGGDDCFHTQVHNTMYKVAREMFLSMISSGGKMMGQSFYTFFALVLYVRRACDHGALVPKENYEDALEIIQILNDESGNTSELNMDAEEAQQLLGKLLAVLSKKETDVSSECCICFDPIGGESEDDEEAQARVLRPCRHIFCGECLEKQLEGRLGSKANCGLCREPFQKKDVLALSELRTALKKKKSKTQCRKKEVAHEGETSPKIKIIMEKIAEMAADEKCVVFSQLIGMLDKVEEALDNAGYTHTRIDGQVSAQDRIQNMEDFESDHGPKVMLISLLAGGVGITLTRANVAIMADPWWNGAVQEQAMDRIHRIGQTREVRVYQLAAKGSIEERMYKLQEAKTALGNGSMRKLSAEERKKARITALKDLFQVNERAANWKGFYEDEAKEDEDGHDNGSDLDGFIVGDDVED